MRTSSGQMRAVASAFSSRTSEMRLIRLERSAIGMNRPGMTLPRAGLSQRASASKPSVRPLAASTIGWNSRSSSASRSASLRARSTSAAAWISVSCSCENLTTEPRTCRLAKFRA